MKKLNDQAMSEAVEKIVSSLGYDVFKGVNTNKFQSVVNDFMPGTMFEIEKQTLLQCVRIGIGDKFIQAVSKTGEEQQRIIASINKTLTDDYAFPRDRADCVIKAFAQALKISLKKVSQRNEKRINTKAEPDVLQNTPPSNCNGITSKVSSSKKSISILKIAPLLYIFGFFVTSICLLVYDRYRFEQIAGFLATLSFLLAIVPGCATLVAVFCYIMNRLYINKYGSVVSAIITVAACTISVSSLFVVVFIGYYFCYIFPFHVFWIFGVIE